jgi:hypothetical protein
MTARTMILGGALLALAPLCRAAEHPSLQPSRDVAVQYHVEARDAGAESRPQMIRMWWTDHGGMLRIEMAGQPSYVLADFRTRRMTMVLPSRKTTLELPLDPHLAPGFVIPDDVAMTPRGSDTVAMTPCTLWDLKGPSGTGRACITQDGVLLRAEGHVGAEAAGAIEAVSVAYGPQPPRLFTVPDGFRRMDLKHLRR